MDSDQFDDLKQFITGVVSQSEKRLEAKLGSRIDTLDLKVDKLEATLTHRMDEGFAGVAEAIAAINDIVDDHERRIIKLETKPA